ncbi:MAG: phosphoglycerate dehydrogenase [Bdellovibrionales bacterium]|nr:phosphoglycerate dehydrogenase [Bdellovibrionales bacterium]
MKIAILEQYSAGAQALLRAANPLVSVTTQLEEAEVLLIRSRTVIDAHFLKKVPNVKLIVTATSGFDHIDWRETQKRGITAAHTPEANAQSTAELTFALLLAWERRLIAAHKNVKSNQWREQLKRPQGLEGHTLGIVGLGRVGSKVARMAHTFGMKVQAYDPYVEESLFAETQAERSGFIELLRTSDYVSLHVPLTKETKHLLNQPTFGEMQHEAILLNTCRGPVVDENDLMTALDDGTIAGAAMDVIEREPPPHGHRILTHPKLLLTPHIGAFTESAWDKSSREAVNKALAFARGETVADTLPLQVAWFERT